MLYIISTPIGNLKDITLRALEVLRSVDVIVCEDTRVTVRLLKTYAINKPLLNYYGKRKITIEAVIALLEKGKHIALVSDAGTPSISDPGSEFVHAVSGAGLPVSVIPGPSALTAALALSGMDTLPFIFLGFWHKSFTARILNNPVFTDFLIVFYESPYRVLKTLKSLLQYCGTREVVMFKELTKFYEQVYRGSCEEVISILETKSPPKGEYVIILGKSS